MGIGASPKCGRTQNPLLWRFLLLRGTQSAARTFPAPFAEETVLFPRGVLAFWWKARWLHSILLHWPVSGLTPAPRRLRRSFAVRKCDTPSFALSWDCWSYSESCAVHHNFRVFFLFVENVTGIPYGLH